MKYTMRSKRFYNRPHLNLIWINFIVANLKNLLIIFTGSILLLTCSNRDRDNIFDPRNSNSTIDLDLRIISQDSLINLYWIEPSENYSGIKLFRKQHDESGYSLLGTLAENTTSYQDIISAYNEEVSYYLKAVGDGIESDSTKPVSIVPGPGTIWVVDPYFWEISRFNYDLSSNRFRILTSFSPENIAFANDDGLLLVTSPAFSYYEILRADNGIPVAESFGIRKPFDAIYDPQAGQFWLVDSTGGLYSIDKEGTATLVNDKFDQPAQIDLFENKLYILDKKANKIFIYNNLSSLIDSISITEDNSPFASLKLFRIDKQQRNLYILDSPQGHGTLYKYEIESANISEIYSDSLMYLFDVNPLDETIWIVRDNKVNSEIMQLSSSGNRLHSLSEFIKPTDIRINPFNGNVVVADPFLDDEKAKLFHYRSDLTLIGSYIRVVPFKVYIE